MTFRRFAAQVSAYAVAIGLVTIMSVGGCPIAQQPSTTSNDNQTSDNSSTTPPNNQLPSNRPIPPPPIDEGTDGGDTGGGTGGGGTGGDGGGGGGGGSQPISVAITAPQGFDINVLPGGQAFTTYEVFGGNPADGQIGVSLFYDSDGLANTGDETTVQTGLPPRGTARFTANLNPGIYRLGIRAENTRDATVAYATGRLVIVGEPGIQFIQPNADQRVRPGAAVTVQLVITSLATAVNYTVFTDRDGVFNGDEVTAFSGGGLGGTGTILTTGFNPGDHFIGATVSDSTGQTKTEYFRAGGTLRKITIDRAPTIQTLAPTGNVLIDPAVTPTIQVRFRAGDPEGAAAASAFRDVDAVFNGNEVMLGTEIQITAPGEQEYVVDVPTASLPFGTFRFGARVSDGVGNPIVSYATGTARVNAPPNVNVTAPSSDVFVNSGTGVQILFTVNDPEARLQPNGISVLTARDEDLDFVPDGPPTVIANLPNNSTSYVLTTNALLGRYLVGIRATDDVGAQTTRWATGTVNVQNRPPVVVIEDPTELVAVRPADGEDVFMEFVVGDPEFSLAPQPNGVQVQLARDDDADGTPDGDPVFTDGTGLRLGRNFYFFDTDVFNDPGILNASGFGRFLLGVRAQDQAGNVAFAWLPLVADTIEPTITITQPTGTINVDRVGAFEVRLVVTDTSGSDVRVMLDSNSIPLQHDSNPNDRTEYEFTLVSSTPTGNPNETEFILSLDLNANAVPVVPGGEYNLYIVVDDLVGSDVVERIGFYAPQGTSQPRDFWKVRVRDRLFGTFDLAQLDAGPPQGVPSYGAVLRGFNINDLAGSSMARLPDVNDDGNDEAMFVSRFGRAHLIQQRDTHGIGEAYMIYGNAERLRGIQTFNAVGQGLIPGLIYPGIRPVFWNPQSRNWVGTEGISDFTIIPDMDGDDLPELVFGFPRCESVSLRVQDQEAQPQTDGTRVDLPGMGSLEYSAWNPQTRAWTTNEAQFTRGGVVIVSSHNDIIRDPAVRNRRNSRALDLHEVGQMFAAMSAPSLVPYLRPVGAPCNPMDPNTHIADGTDCGADPDQCSQGPSDELPVVDNAIPNGRGACCTPCNGCVVLTPAECTQLGGTFNGNRVPCVGNDGGNPPQARQACQDPQEQEWEEWILRWDVVFNNQPPGGFHMDWTQPPSNGKPLANPAPFPYAPAPFMPPAWFGDRAHDDFCCLEPRDCFWTSGWYDWSGGGAVPFPCTNQDLGTQITNSWLASDGASSVWTGFYGPYTSIRQDAIGARVLGQALDDRFGAAVASEGVWLYTAAPNRSAQVTDVPALASAGGNRNGAGVVYQLRVDQRSGANAPTKAQLWMEPFNTEENGNPGPAAVWPQIDKELPGRTDDTMPVPHQYIIESMGSTRWDQPANFDPEHPQVCSAVPQVDPGQDFGPPADSCRSIPYPVDTAGGTVSESPQQIVGPHVNAKLRYVKALADANGDGIRDVAIGSTDIREVFTNPQSPSGATVGGVFILYTRPTGVPGDYLLERITLDPANLNRLNGVYIHGVSGAKIGRAFDNASDFNGDGVDDVIIGSHESNGGAGRVLILLGSITDTLLSPQGGWTLDQVPASRAVHLIGAGTENAGYNVTGAGDVDGDGVGDVLISAPNAEGGKGVVYLVYGRTDISADNNTFNLADIGTAALPGAKFIGRTVTGFNYNLGGGELSTALNPSGPATLIVSDGVSSLGDIDGDGLKDYAISAMRARPNNRTDAGEVFVLYGRGQIIENP